MRERARAVKNQRKTDSGLSTVNERERRRESEREREREERTNERTNEIKKIKKESRGERRPDCQGQTRVRALGMHPAGKHSS